MTHRHDEDPELDAVNDDALENAPLDDEDAALVEDSDEDDQTDENDEQESAGASLPSDDPATGEATDIYDDYPDDVKG